MKCVTGCGRRSVHRHHAGVYTQELRRIAGRDKAWFRALYKDPRNLTPTCLKCHSNHHAVVEKIRLECLPDSVFEFAAEILGPGLAYNTLRRRYAGDDSRLDALLSDSEDHHADAA